MKKILFVAIGASIGLFACNDNKDTKATAAPKNTDLITQNLKGKVKQITETNTNIDSLGVSKPDSVTVISIFDSTGYQNSYYTKDSTGKHRTEQFLRRDSAGFVVEFRSEKDGKQAFRMVLDVKDGIYTGAKNFDSTDKQDSYFTDLKTNEYGQVYEGKQHFMDGRLKNTFATKYQAALYIGGTNIDSTGKTDYSGTMTLDDKGNTASENYTTIEKGVTKKTANTFKYEYDDKGNWTQRTTINDKGKTTNISKRALTYF